MCLCLTASMESDQAEVEVEEFMKEHAETLKESWHRPPVRITE